MISILVTGISGRMGQAIQEAVTQNPDTCVGSTHDQGQGFIQPSPNAT